MWEVFITLSARAADAGTERPPAASVRGCQEESGGGGKEQEEQGCRQVKIALESAAPYVRSGGAQFYIQFVRSVNFYVWLTRVYKFHFVWF